MNRVVLGTIIATAIIAVATGRWTFARIDRLNVSWKLAWLKTLVIVVGIATLVVFVPGWVMSLGPVADLDRVAQDLIGSGVFIIGLVLSLWLLSRAQKSSRI